MYLLNIVLLKIIEELFESLVTLLPLFIDEHTVDGGVVKSLKPCLFLSPRPASKSVEGLARVGSRAALSFAFAFLRRAWRSGKNFSNPCWENLSSGKGDCSC